MKNYRNAAKWFLLLFCFACASEPSMVCAGSSESATTLCFSLKESNRLPDGAIYATACLSYIYDGAKRGVTITVQADEKTLVPCNNFGIQRFGFSTTIDAPEENLILTLPSRWSSRFARPARGWFDWLQVFFFNYGAFGRFGIDTRTVGRGRVNPLFIEIFHVTDNLSFADFAVPNDDGYIFSAHIADYTFDDSFCTSAYFGSQEQPTSTTTTSVKVTTTTVPLSTTTSNPTTSTTVKPSTTTTSKPVSTTTSSTVPVTTTSVSTTTSSQPVSTTSTSQSTTTSSQVTSTTSVPSTTTSAGSTSTSTIPPCTCNVAPDTSKLLSEQSELFTVTESTGCRPSNYIWSTDCVQGNLAANCSGSASCLFTAGTITEQENCSVCVNDAANNNPPVSCCAAVELKTTPECQVEIAEGIRCEEALPIDNPVFGRPGRRGMALTCNDVVDFCICTDCDPLPAPECYQWSYTPAGEYVELVTNPDGSARLTVLDACNDLKDAVQLQVTVEDTCNNAFDSVVIEVGKLVVAVEDTSADPQRETTVVAVNLDNPDHFVRAMNFNITECQGLEDNLVCTGCTPDVDRALGFTCSAREQSDGSCEVVLYSTVDLIARGTGSILTVQYEQKKEFGTECVCLAPVSFYVANQFNEELCACGDPGNLCFRVCGDIYPQDCLQPECEPCGDGRVDLFDILEMIDIILELTVPTDCQLNNGDVPNGIPPFCGNPPGEINCLSDGDIDIFDLLVITDMALDKANCCDFCFLGQIF